MKDKINIGDILEGNLHSNRSGSGYFVSDNIKKDIYIHRTNTNKALHLDKVKINVFKGKDRALEGEILEIVERFKTKFVGTLQVSEKFAFLVPDSQKMTTDIFIPLKKLKGGKHGQKVVGELTEWRDDRKTPNGRVIEVLGDVGDNDAEIHAILETYELPYKFSEDVLDEIKLIDTNISDIEISKRRDMRDTLTICIDPLGSRDKDDSISYKRIDAYSSEVGIHIADVSYYVRPGTELDKEAFERGTSVYLVDRVVPMFPEALSNGICSLNPNEDKLTFSAIFTLNNLGEIMSEWYGRTVINIDKDYTYEDAQKLIDGVVEVSCDSDNSILELNEIAKNMRKKRMKGDSLSFNSEELRFILDEKTKKPTGIKIKVQKEANKLVEEFMLLANKKVCEYLTSKKIPVIHRVHESPDIDKLHKLKIYLQSIGFDININDEENIKLELNKLIKSVRGTQYEKIINNLVVRTMQKALYSTENLGHYGLGFEHYSHFTSPIRRFADLCIHRLLANTLGNHGYPIK